MSLPTLFPRLLLSLALSHPAVMVWADNSSVNATAVPAQADAQGRYRHLIQVMPCPTDQESYGQYRDWGYWGGGAWCGQIGRAGYWVWVSPNWYVWKDKVN